MAAQATATRAPARRAASRIAAPRRAARPAPRTAPRLLPGAFGRTLVVVGGLADSGVIVRLTRSQAWIGLTALLLVGIVALNVVALSLNAGTSKTAALSDQLRQENQALRAEITGGLSNERLQHVAARMGLVVPEPGAIRYLTPSSADAAAAASRVRRGAITFGTPVAEVAIAPSTAIAAAPAAAVAPAIPEPVATEPQVTEPTATPVAPAVATGGAIAP